MHCCSRALLSALTLAMTLTMTLIWALPAAGPALAQEGPGWIGVNLQDVTKAEADKLGWDTPRGAKLGLIAAGSPAERAGLKAGDIVVAIDRTLIEASSELDAAIAAKRPGEEVRLQVLSSGRERRVAFMVAGRPRPQIADASALPILMLDPGGHMALIRGLAFTPDGKQLVSAGDDKVIRVWDWQAGKTARTIRGQVGPGLKGQIYAMALSPDGRWLALGGWTDPAKAKVPCCGDIRLYDFATGRLVALLKGHTSIVNGLAFSPDGKRLISGTSLGDLSAIIWDVERRALIHRLVGHKAEIFGVGFTPDGARAVTGSHDTTLKLWSVKDGKEIATLAGHGEKVRALAVSPVNGSIASGSWDGQIRLWDGVTGQFLRVLGTQEREVGSLTFSGDGKLLLSGAAAGGSGRNFSRVWDVATGRVTVTYAKHDNVVLAAAVSPDRRLVATGGGNNNESHIWDPKTGETKKVLAGTGAARWAVGFSPDGQHIAWSSVPHGGGNQLSRLEFQLRLPAGSQILGQPQPVDEISARGFVRARATFGAYMLAHRKGGTYGYDAILDVRKDGQTIASIERGPSDGYQHRSYSFTPDGKVIISGGGSGVILAYDLNGRKLGDFVGNESEVWAVTPSPDGRLLVSGSADQTVRLWNLETRELIVTLFHGSDGEWVMWTPQGYYTGSPGADKIVGWQINKGPDKEADYVKADQLRQHLNRPDIVETAIILASAEQAVREAPGTNFKLADLLSRPLPRFKIVSPSPGSTQRAGRANVKIAIEATPDPVSLVRVEVNSRNAGERAAPTGSGGFTAGEHTLAVPLAKGRNEIRIALTNAIGEQPQTLIVNNEGDGELDQRGVLHIVAIGVNDYKGLPNTCGEKHNVSCDLTSPGDDARKFAAAIEERLRPGHVRVVKRVLVNGADAKNLPTANNILDAVGDLRQARENDTVVLFIAGHGLNEGRDYYFLPTNAELAGGVLRGSTVVPWQVLQGVMEAAKGRRLMFVDTCHSGNAYNQRLGNAAYHANIIAYSSARFDQLALEDPALGHGLFTYAVVEGLEGKGGLRAKGQMSTKDLHDYVVGRVGALAKVHKREQVPQYFKGRDAEEFMLARW